MLVIPHVTTGRDAELLALAESLDELSEGRGGCVWIEGEAGIGKSHLVAELLGRATAQDASVLVGYAEQLMRTFPLRAAADTLGISRSVGHGQDPASTVVARLLSGERVDGVSYADPVLAAAERMIEIVERMCTQQALVLVMEDLQWSDEASLVLLDRLSAETDQIPLLLALTTRPVTAGSDSSREALARRATRRLDLAPLNGAEVRALAESRLEAGLGPQLSALLDTAAGSPLYVHEILDFLGRDDLRALSGNRLELASDTPTAGRPAEALGRRLDSLDPSHLQVIRLAALLGDGFASTDLALILASDPEPALRSAAGAGIVAPSDDHTRFRFHHELIRQVLMGQLSTAVRSGMHDHIARTLAVENRPESMVAGHLLAAGDPLTGWALRWLAERPESTLYTAPAAYAELLTRATSGPVDSATGELRAALVQRLVLASFWLGRDEAVIAWGDEAIEGAAADPDLAARLRIQVLRSLARQGRFEEAARVVAPSVDDPAASPAWRARAAAWSNLQGYLGDFDEARSVAQGALELATSVGDSLGIAYAHMALAPVDGADHAIGHLEAVLAVPGDEPDLLDLRLVVSTIIAYQLGTAGDPRAEKLLEEALATAERVGTFRTASLHAVMAGYLYEHDRWDDALLHIAQIDATALPPPVRAALQGARAIIAYRRGDLEEGARILAAAGVPEPGPDEDPGQRLIEAAALRAESAGHLERGLAIRSRYLELPSNTPRQDRAHEALYLIRQARALGAVDIATAAAKVVADVDEPDADKRLVIAACQAVLARDVSELRRIAEEFLAGQWQMCAAFAFEEAADALAEAGDLSNARTEFLRATDIYDDRGADWDLRRATARFRPYGIRRGAHAPPREKRTGWEALTATELHIGKLVARGYSNSDIARELIITRNTVQVHVSNMLAKLGMRSRIELAREIVLHDRP